MLIFRYACTFLLIIIGLGCVVNTEEGKCRREIKIEKIDKGDPCEMMLLFGIGAGIWENEGVANSDANKKGNDLLVNIFAFQCWQQEQKKYACGKKSNILPVLQEPRGDIN